MGRVIDFFQTVRVRRTMDAGEWVYDIHFDSPDGCPTIWTLTAPDEERARGRVTDMWGADCRITKVRCVGHTGAGP